MNQGTFDEGSDRHQSRIPVLVASCVLAFGILLSFLAYRVLRDKEKQIAQEQLNVATEHRVRVLEKAFRRSPRLKATCAPSARYVTR